MERPRRHEAVAGACVIAYRPLTFGFASAAARWSVCDSSNRSEFPWSIADLRIRPMSAIFQAAARVSRQPGLRQTLGT